MTPEEDLMTTLYVRHYPILVSFARRYVGAHHQAEDIAQETLLRAWRNIDTIEPDHQRIRSYLLTIARHVLTDTWRSEQRRPLAFISDEALSEIPSGEDLEDRLDVVLLRTLLKSLSPEHREAIVARYYEDLTLRSAADNLLIPTGTVKSRVHYALEVLRSAYQETAVA